MRTRYLTFPLVTRDANGDVYSVTITTSDTDRMGDVVEPGGGQFDNWRRAGMPVLYGHRRDELPIGRGLSVTPTPTGWRMSFQFLQGDEFAQRAERAWNAGALGAASIGFVALAETPLPGGGFRITSWDLVEVSLTPTPANAAATRALKSLGLPVGDDEPVLLLRDALPESTSATWPSAVVHARADLAGFLASVGEVEGATAKYDPLRAAIEQVDAFLDALTNAALGRRSYARPLAPTLPRARRDDEDDLVLLLADGPDDLLSIGDEEMRALPDLLGRTLRDAVGPIVGHEIRRAINHARGRVD